VHRGCDIRGRRWPHRKRVAIQRPREEEEEEKEKEEKEKEREREREREREGGRARRNQEMNEERNDAPRRHHSRT